MNEISMYLQELKQRNGNPTIMQIAEMSNIPESSVSKLLSGANCNPRFDSLVAVVTSLGGSLDELVKVVKRCDSVNFGTPIEAVESAIRMERAESMRALSDDEREKYKARIQKVTETGLAREARFREEHLSILEATRARHEARERAIRSDARRREICLFCALCAMILFHMILCYINFNANIERIQPQSVVSESFEAGVSLLNKTDQK